MLTEEQARKAVELLTWYVERSRATARMINSQRLFCPDCGADLSAHDHCLPCRVRDADALLAELREAAKLRRGG